MKQIVGFIVLAFLQLMVACSSMASWETRQWQPTAVNDFESVAAAIIFSRSFCSARIKVFNGGADCPGGLRRNAGLPSSEENNEKYSRA